MIMDNILEVENISKTFFPPLTTKQLLCADFRRKNGVRALEDVSFSVKNGRILAILGPNGAGKTTLLKILTTLILPDKGWVRINGYEAGEAGCETPKIRSMVGFASSPERSFYPRLTGEQNLNFFGSLNGLSHEQIASRLAELYKLFEIDYEKKRFDSYSAGMQQKISILRALIHDPALLLLDEPTRSLDYRTAGFLKKFIKEDLAGRQNKTVIFTTHSMEEAADFADVFMILRKGSVFGYGTLSELRKKINNPEAALGDIFLKLTKKDDHA
ncbi:MAG: ATP-binding cassette domain-containing protein [Candidatus Omnitrophota bacterium]